MSRSRHPKRISLPAGVWVLGYAMGALTPPVFAMAVGVGAVGVPLGMTQGLLAAMVADMAPAGLLAWRRHD